MAHATATAAGAHPVPPPSPCYRCNETLSRAAKGGHARACRVGLPDEALSSCNLCGKSDMSRIALSAHTPHCPRRPASARALETSQCRHCDWPFANGVGCAKHEKDCWKISEEDTEWVKCESCWEKYKNDKKNKTKGPQSRPFQCVFKTQKALDGHLQRGNAHKRRRSKRVGAAGQSGSGQDKENTLNAA